MTLLLLLLAGVVVVAMVLLVPLFGCPGLPISEVMAAANAAVKLGSLVKAFTVSATGLWLDGLIEDGIVEGCCCPSKS